MIALRILGTPVRVKPAVLVIVAALWAGTAALDLYLHPGRGFWPAVLIGFVTMVLLLLADFGHPLGHILSARYAGAPMDEVRITVTEMPHTLYNHNAVSPNVHRIRALGGPIFNGLGLFLSAGVFAAVPAASVARELAAWSAAAHGLMLIMSLAPSPGVDGGTLLKWTLVARGWSEAAAEAAGRRVAWLVGIVAVVLGLGLIALQVWMIGGLFVFAGVIVCGVAAGLVR